MIRLSEIKIGARVRVREWTGGVNVGTVTEVEADIKNGRPGIGYETANGDGYWCYLDQVISVG